MPSESTTRHRCEAGELPPVRVAIITVSDTRTETTDLSGARIRELLAAVGHHIAHYILIRDEPDHIRDEVVRLCGSGDCDVIILNGGTGIAPRDGTFEAISAVLDRTLPGFGELFRMLSWEEVGPAAMLSRAVAGLRGRTLIFSTPGSSNAVNLAMTRLILPELKHLVYEMKGVRG
ncbi:MogA/MoaB family molybdenum cofactor biosynthesis protein [Candidatus Poribacteria bacterium]|nr:MogA/MoaB family molybdenum cofactor biosynthesis protein [Candidatus Poribacteria bacterium]